MLTQGDGPVIAGNRLLVDLLQGHARAAPSRQAVCFLARGEHESAAWTYGQLDRRARAIAATLAEFDAHHKPVLLDYEPGLEFLAAFFGCLYAGAIAIPTQSSSGRRRRERLANIAADAGPGLVLTTTMQQDDLRLAAETVSSLSRATWVATDAIEEGLADAWRRPDLSPDSVAFLQYTSGSTSTPRGVVISNGNLVANLDMMRIAFGLSAQTSTVNWLPHSHDMGLISGLLLPVFVGGRSVQMAPMDFIQKPIRWLRAIDRYRASFSGGPNFAYEQCNGRIAAAEIPKLELSSWRVAFCGAEPVRARTLQMFEQTFAPAGFDGRCLLPCYGLAEATLYVAGSPRGRGVRTWSGSPDLAQGNRVRVSCGMAAPHSEVRIADAGSGKPLSDGEIGEILVAGAHVAQGYWNRPGESVDAFTADSGAGSSDGRRYLRTGDLGQLVDGELYITGRLKDAFKVRGSMQHPEDIESVVVGCHPAFKGGTAAVFAVDDGTVEAVIVLAEIGRTHRADGHWADAARIAYGGVCEAFGFAPTAVAVLAPGSLPRTSSGKIRRSAARDSYRDGSLKVLDQYIAAHP